MQMSNEERKQEQARIELAVRSAPSSKPLGSLYVRAMVRPSGLTRVFLRRTLEESGAGMAAVSTAETNPS